MTGKLEFGPRKALALVAACVAFALTLGWAGQAFAAGEVPPSLTPEQVDALFETLGTVPVFEQSCSYCHGSLVQKDKDRVSEIIFSHGYHRGQFDCSACHSEFPHNPVATKRPTMQQCFSCHGLRHGPVGIVATDKCADCHRTPRDRLRPGFHKADWAKKPHVEPSLKELQTKCMMCHDGPFCDDCHKKEFIRWEPDVPYTYNPQADCMACHGQLSMVRASAGGGQSYTVTGLDTSAHSDVDCVQCHVDFKYEDGPDMTPLWNVNVGYACMGCHDHEKQVADYKTSIHWTSLEGTKDKGGNMHSATCASCHGGHDIQRLDTDAAKTALKNSAFDVCARCHRDKYDSYNDYYHGAAYKKGVPDSPACWDCHGAHKTLPSSNPSSTTSAKKIADTCGTCHTGATEKFAEQAQGLIHKRGSATSDNPLVKFLNAIKDWLT